MIWLILIVLFPTFFASMFLATFFSLIFIDFFNWVDKKTKWFRIISLEMCIIITICILIILLMHQTGN